VRIQSVVLLIFLLLTAVVGWLVAQVASPKLLILLIGVAIGMIVGAPVSLVVANLLGSQAPSVPQRPPVRYMRNSAPTVMPTYPQVTLVVPPVSPQGYPGWLETYEEVSPYDEPPLRPIQFLGEE